MIVYPSDVNTVNIVQSMDFKNTGTEKETELPIYLPEGYSNLELRGGLAEADMEKTENGIVDTSGLDAGEGKLIIVSYQMPMEQNVSQWTITQSYVTEDVQVMIQPGILSFQATDLVTQSQLIEIDGQEYRRFTRLDLHPDVPWTLSFRLIDTVEGNESETTPSKPSAGSAVIDPSGEKFTEDGIPIIGAEHERVFFKTAFTFGTIAVALSAALIGLRRDRQSTIVDVKKRSRPWLHTQKEQLLKQMFDLEKDYHNELISEQTYESVRAKIRSQIIKITAELQQR